MEQCRIHLRRVYKLAGIDPEHLKVFRICRVESDFKRLNHKYQMVTEKEYLKRLADCDLSSEFLREILR